MEIGFRSSSQPVEEYFKFAVDTGFGRMDLGCNAPANFPHTFTDERIKRVRKLGGENGIRYGLNSASYVNNSEIMPKVRKASEEHLLEYIQLSGDTGQNIA